MPRFRAGRRRGGEARGPALACLALASSLLPVAAAAQDIEIEPLTVRGLATIHEAEVSADCVDHPSFREVSCALLYRFRLVAGGPVTLEGAPGVRVDGALLAAPRALAEGEAVEVRAVHRDLELTVERGWFGLVMQPNNGIRHLLLGESWLRHQRRHYADTPLARGDALRRVGPLRVRADTGSLARLRAEGDVVVLELRGEQPVEIDGAFDHGGPVVSVGGRWFLTPPNEDRVHLGVGYELGLTDFFILGAWIETDLDSLYQALLIEVVLPGAIFVVPGLGVGLGAVARQLGPRDADAALRVRVSAQWVVVGVAADFDYWPALGRWTGVLRARVSL